MPQSHLDNIQYKASNGQINLNEAEGIVECFVAGIGNKDSVGDVCAPGAFAKSLQRRKPRVVWGHNWNDPIGKVLDIYEVPSADPRLPAKMKAAGIGGLYARVQFNLHSEKGREAFANVAFFGEEQEWSIGYKTLRAEFDNNIQANVLYEVELYEVSPVLHGANQLTGTISVKTDDEKAHGGMAILGTDFDLEDGVFDDGVAKPIGSQVLEALKNDLSKRAGGPIEIVEANESTVVFKKPGKGVFRIAYYNNGSEFMYGKPELISVDKPSQMPSGPTPVAGVVAKPSSGKPNPNMTAPAVPVAIKPGPNGPIAVPLPPVEYEGASDKKPVVVAEEQDLADALVEIAKKYGKFNEDGTGVWAGYVPASENENAEIGVKCSNCILYKGNGECAIIEKKVEDDGSCRFAVIPDNVVKVGDKKKSYTDGMDDQEFSIIEDLEEKYPGEFILGVVRGITKRRKRRKNRGMFKTLDQFGIEEAEIQSKGLDPDLAQSAMYIIPVEPKDAFNVKSAIDPVLDYHGIGSYVSEDGIIIYSGLTQESKDALEVATKAAFGRAARAIGRGARNMGRRLGPGRGRGGRGLGMPSGDLDPRTRRDTDLDGTLFDGIPGWEQPDPTPDGPGSINNPKPTRAQIQKESSKRRAAKPKTSGEPKREVSPSVMVFIRAEPDATQPKQGLGIDRHANRSVKLSPADELKEQAKRQAHEKIAEEWRGRGLGWVEVPRSNTGVDAGPRGLSEDYFRGLEIGVNQARVMWAGDPGRKRPRGFSEDKKGSKEYAEWYKSYAKAASDYLSKHRKDDYDMSWRAIEYAIREDVAWREPSGAGMRGDEEKNFGDYLRRLGFEPSRIDRGGRSRAREQGGLSSGRGMDPEQAADIDDRRADFEGEAMLDRAEEMEDRARRRAARRSGREDGFSAGLYEGDSDEDPGYAYEWAYEEAADSWDNFEDEVSEYYNQVLGNKMDEIAAAVDGGEMTPDQAKSEIRKFLGLPGDFEIPDDVLGPYVAARDDENDEFWDSEFWNKISDFRNLPEKSQKHIRKTIGDDWIDEEAKLLIEQDEQPRDSDRLHGLYSGRRSGREGGFSAGSDRFKGPDYSDGPPPLSIDDADFLAQDALDNYRELSRRRGVTDRVTFEELVDAYSQIEEALLAVSEAVAENRGIDEPRTLKELRDLQFADSIDDGDEIESEEFWDLVDELSLAADELREFAEDRRDAAQEAADQIDELNELAERASGIRESIRSIDGNSDVEDADLIVNEIGDIAYGAGALDVNTDDFESMIGEDFDSDISDGNIDTVKTKLSRMLDSVLDSISSRSDDIETRAPEFDEDGLRRMESGFASGAGGDDPWYEALSESQRASDRFPLGSKERRDAFAKIIKDLDRYQRRLDPDSDDFDDAQELKGQIRRLRDGKPNQILPDEYDDSYEELQRLKDELQPSSEELQRLKDELQPSSSGLASGANTREIDTARSSALRRVRYNEDDGTLTVEFTTGKEYTYPDVDPEDVRMLEEAESKGRAFAEIRKKYKGTVSEGSLASGDIGAKRDRIKELEERIDPLYTQWEYLKYSDDLLDGTRLGQIIDRSFSDAEEDEIAREFSDAAAEIDETNRIIGTLDENNTLESRINSLVEAEDYKAASDLLLEEYKNQNSSTLFGDKIDELEREMAPLYDEMQRLEDELQGSSSGSLSSGFRPSPTREDFERDAGEYLGRIGEDSPEYMGRYREAMMLEGPGSTPERVRERMLEDLVDEVEFAYEEQQDRRADEDRIEQFEREGGFSSGLNLTPTREDFERLAEDELFNRMDRAELARRFAAAYRRVGADRDGDSNGRMIKELADELEAQYGEMQDRRADDDQIEREGGFASGVRRMNTRYNPDLLEDPSLEYNPSYEYANEEWDAFSPDGPREYYSEDISEKIGDIASAVEDGDITPEQGREEIRKYLGLPEGFVPENVFELYEQDDFWDSEFGSAISDPRNLPEEAQKHIRGTIGEDWIQSEIAQPQDDGGFSSGLDTAGRITSNFFAPAGPDARPFDEDDFIEDPNLYFRFRGDPRFRAAVDYYKSLLMESNGRALYNGKDTDHHARLVEGWRNSLDDFDKKRRTAKQILSEQMPVNTARGIIHRYIANHDAIIEAMREGREEIEEAYMGLARLEEDRERDMRAAGTWVEMEPDDADLLGEEVINDAIDSSLSGGFSSGRDEIRDRSISREERDMAFDAARGLLDGRGISDIARDIAIAEGISESEALSRIHKTARQIGVATRNAASSDQSYKNGRSILSLRRMGKSLDDIANQRLVPGVETREQARQFELMARSRDLSLLMLDHLANVAEAKKLWSAFSYRDFPDDRVALSMDDMRNWLGYQEFNEAFGEETLGNVVRLANSANRDVNEMLDSIIRGRDALDSPMGIIEQYKYKYAAGPSAESGFSSGDSKEKIREGFSKIQAQLMEMLETADPNNWKAPWSSLGLSPANGQTKNPYRGFNAFWLSWATSSGGYAYPIFATFNQWKKMGGSVRKGQKAAEHIIRPNFVDKVDPETGKTKKVLVGWKSHAVFNVDQIDGVDVKDLLPEQLPEGERISILEEGLAQVGAEIRTGSDGMAFYSPSGDFISMPPFGSFRDAKSYYATLAHEIIHWTGHSSRLDRPKMNSFGTPEYAFEELIAEIGSAMLLGILGIEAELRPDHAEYLKGWLRALKGDKDALQKAFEAAQKAVESVLKASPTLAAKAGYRPGKDSDLAEEAVDAGFSSGARAWSARDRAENVLSEVGMMLRGMDGINDGSVGDWADNTSMAILDNYGIDPDFVNGYPLIPSDQRLREAGFSSGRIDEAHRNFASTVGAEYGLPDRASAPGLYSASPNSGKLRSDTPIVGEDGSPVTVASELGLGNGSPLSEYVAHMNISGDKFYSRPSGVDGGDKSRWDMYVSPNGMWAADSMNSYDVDADGNPIYEPGEMSSPEFNSPEELDNWIRGKEEAKNAYLSEFGDAVRSGNFEKASSMMADQSALRSVEARQARENRKSRRIPSSSFADSVSRIDEEKAKWSPAQWKTYNDSILDSANEAIAGFASGVKSVPEDSIEPEAITRVSQATARTDDLGKNARTIASALNDSAPETTGDISVGDLNSISFEYKGESRSVIPFSLLAGKNGGVYVNGFDTNAGAFRSFRLDRMTGLVKADGPNLKTISDDGFSSGRDSGVTGSPWNVSSPESMYEGVESALDTAQVIDPSVSGGSWIGVGSENEYAIEYAARDLMSRRDGLISAAIAELRRRGDLGDIDEKTTSDDLMKRLFPDSPDAENPIAMLDASIDAHLERLETLQRERGVWTSARDGLRDSITRGRRFQDMNRSTVGIFDPIKYGAKVPEMIREANEISMPLRKILGDSQFYGSRALLDPARMAIAEIDEIMGMVEAPGFPENLSPQEATDLVRRTYSAVDRLMNRSSEISTSIGSYLSAYEGSLSRTPASAMRSDSVRDVFESRGGEDGFASGGWLRKGSRRLDFRLPPTREERAELAQKVNENRALVGLDPIQPVKMSGNDTRSPDGPWLLQASKLLDMMIDPKTKKPMSDEEIAEALGTTVDAVKLMRDPSYGITEADVVSWIDTALTNRTRGHNQTLASTDSLVEAIWGYDSRPYWYDKMENPMSRADYEDAIEEGDFAFGHLVPIDFSTEDIIGAARRDYDRPVALAPSSGEYDMKALAEYLGLDMSDTNDSRLDKTLSEALSFVVNGELFQPTPRQIRNWRETGVPTAIIEQMVESGLIPNAETAFGEIGKNFDSQINQYRAWQMIKDILERMGKPPKGTQFDRITGVKKTLYRLDRYNQGLEGQFSPRLGKALRYTREQVQKMIDIANQEMGTSIKIEDILG